MSHLLEFSCTQCGENYTDTTDIDPACPKCGEPAAFEGIPVDQLCERCEENPPLKHDDYCAECLEQMGEAAFERQQERLMETGGPDPTREDQHLRDAGRGHLVRPS